MPMASAWVLRRQAVRLVEEKLAVQLKIDSMTSNTLTSISVATGFEYRVFSSCNKVVEKSSFTATIVFAANNLILYQRQLGLF